MPQGNDTAAHAEFLGQYGAHANAEQLLAAHRAGMSPALRAANLKSVDAAATDELDLSKITPSQGGEVISASVRGGQIVYLAELPTGRVYKDTEPHTKDAAKRSYETPAEATARADARAQTRVRAVGADIQARLEQEVEDFRAKLNEKYGEELREAQEAAADEVGQAQKDAEKQDTSGGPKQADKDKK